MNARWLALLILGVIGCSGANDSTPVGFGQGTGAGNAGAVGSGVGGGAAGATAGTTGTTSDAGTNGPGKQGPRMLADGGECSAVSKMAEVERGPADIVWVIDSSCSMSDEQAAIASNVGAFADRIANSGVDTHLVIITDHDLADGSALGMDASRYLFVEDNVGSTEALERFLVDAPDFTSFLRTEAPLHVIVTTDDESSMPGEEFYPMAVSAVGKDFTFHSIASEEVMGGPCPCGGSLANLSCKLTGAEDNSAADVGEIYYALSDQTGGQKMSVCTQDWNGVFDKLEGAVLASIPLPCAYDIPPPPAGETFDGDLVNVEHGINDSRSTFGRVDDSSLCANHAAWYYDNPDSPSQILLCPGSCTAVSAGGTIDIAFGCVTELIDII